MTSRRLPAIVKAVPLVAGMCVHGVGAAASWQESDSVAEKATFDGYENARIPACRNGADWVRDAAVQTYFKDAFYDLDARFMAFTATAEQRARTAAAMQDETMRLESYGFLHEQIMGLIPGLGRLLPRIAQSSDLPPLVEEMLHGKVSAPFGVYGRGHVQHLRVALAREMLAVPPPVAHDPGPRIAAFLTYFSAVEAMLSTLKTDSGSEADTKALAAMLDALALGWRDGFRPIARNTIFADSAAGLSKRLYPHVMAQCGWPIQEDNE